MNQPCLIAATPRAGRWNHRFIVAPGTHFTEADVARWVDEAQRAYMGRDYLAVVRDDVVQSESGRCGKELLILVGMAMKRLSETDRSHIQQNLTNRLGDLEHLVLQKVEWEQEGRQTLVAREELYEWYQQDVADVLEKGGVDSCPQKSRRSHRWFLPVLVVLLLGIGSLLMGKDLFEKLKSLVPSRSPNPATNTKDNPKNVPLTDVALWARAVGIETGNTPTPTL
ncbi:MAG: hypothetical protein KDA84_18750, partial [Planctomycetaceae bacterium]|nr:hypothetical protein [Planctomycetaceae bacterium]